MSSRGDVKELVAKYYNVRIFGISRQMNMEISSRKIERPPDGFVPSCVLFVIAVVSFRYLSTTKFFTLRMQAIIQGVTVHVEPKKRRKNFMQSYVLSVFVYEMSITKFLFRFCVI